jgi:hypothetical protein
VLVSESVYVCVSVCVCVCICVCVCVCVCQCAISPREGICLYERRTRPLICSCACVSCTLSTSMAYRLLAVQRERQLRGHIEHLQLLQLHLNRTRPGILFPSQMRSK